MKNPFYHGLILELPPCYYAYTPNDGTVLAVGILVFTKTIGYGNPGQQKGIKRFDRKRRIPQRERKADCGQPPSHVKQTTATKKSASEFGQCSQWAKHLRKSLAPLLTGLTDSAMHSRFNAVLYNAVKSNTQFPIGQRSPLNSDLQTLVGFDFNTHSPFATHCRAALNATLTPGNELTVSLADCNPAEAIHFREG